MSGALVYTPVQAIGLADYGVGWVADVTGIYLTTDQGRSWRTITPPNLANEAVSDRIGALDAVGQNDLWLALEDVPGLVPYSPQSPDGSYRGEGIDRSTDDGQTWTFGASPGCLQACGANLSMSFVDPEHGFAAIGSGQAGSTMMFSTDDGGATWTGLGAKHNLGGSAQIVFSSALDGWAVTGPTFGDHGQQKSSGGVPLSHGRWRCLVVACARPALDGPVRSSHVLRHQNGSYAEQPRRCTCTVDLDLRHRRCRGDLDRSRPSDNRRACEPQAQGTRVKLRRHRTNELED